MRSNRILYIRGYIIHLKTQNMKRLLLLSAAIMIALGSSAQITIASTYTSYVSLIKLEQSGYKYYTTKQNLIKIYNTNHSLWKTITIPAQTAPIQSISYISENTFDTDSQIEYLVSTFAMSIPNPTSTAASSYTAKVTVYKENGNVLFSRDSAQCGYFGIINPFGIAEGVFNDGTGTKLKVGIYDTTGFSPMIIKYEIYDLPGTIPCISCSSATPNTTGLSKSQTASSAAPIFYPNPASNHVKINYQLPADYKKAYIRIQDPQGKLIESFEITSDFNDLLVPASYQNGLYLYTLEVDGSVIKTDKIIVDK